MSILEEVDLQKEVQNAGGAFSDLEVAEEILNKMRSEDALIFSARD